MSTNHLPEVKDFVEWAKGQGASRVCVGDVEVEFRDTTDTDIELKRVEVEAALDRAEQTRIEAMPEEERREIEETRRNKLIYMSS